MQEDPTKLRVERIIALKRYEQPPPGYFYMLPNRIISRIEMGEQPASFWEKLWPNFAVRPSLAYALGLTVFGALTAGIFYVPTRTSGFASRESSIGTEWAVVSTADESPAEYSRPHGLRVSSSYDSTSPVPAPRSGSTFSAFQEARAVPASVYMQP